MHLNQRNVSFSSLLMFALATPFFSAACASQTAEDVAQDDVDENVDALKGSSMVGTFAFRHEDTDSLCRDETGAYQWCMYYAKESLVLREDGTFEHHSESGPVPGKANPARATTTFSASGTWRRKWLVPNSIVAPNKIVLRGDQDTERRVRERDWDSRFIYWRRDVLTFVNEDLLEGDFGTGACWYGCKRVSSQ